MSDPCSSLTQLEPAPATGFLARQLRRAVLARLDRIEGGRITLREGGTVDLVGQPGELDVVVDVHDSGLWTSLALRGSVGAGESYERGEWLASDLAALMRLFARNREVLDRLDSGLARLTRPALRLVHWLRPNSRSGSRKNIAAHYDLGNDFFATFLDPSMTYSCALFERADSTLEEASLAKIDRALVKLDLQPGEHLLEIGTGWGALAIRAAGRYGARVTTATISAEQARLARARIDAAGLTSRVTVLETDYRDLDGRFDKIVSIEMIEAIGHAQLPVFFATCRRLLPCHGSLLVQAITIADPSYNQARRSVDYIKRYIFPGSCIPSNTAILQAATAGSDLRLTHLESLTPHYARTLREWRMRLLAARGELLERGATESFLRRWEMYFALCEGGFAERYLGDVQMLFEGPRRRADPVMGLLAPASHHAG